MKSVYYSLIHSHLSYCINTWGSASSCNLKPLQILEKHIIRLIAGSEYRARSSPLFSQLQILQLEDIYTIEVAKHRINAQTSKHRINTNQRSNIETSNQHESTHKLNTNQRSNLELINYCPISKIHSYETRKSVQDNYYV